MHITMHMPVCITIYYTGSTELLTKNMEEPLAATVGDLLAHMNVMENAVGVSKDYLKRQFNAPDAG